MTRLSRSEVSQFLRAYDGSEDLRTSLALRYPKEVSALNAFRRRMGDTCIRLRYLVTNLNAKEIQRVGPGWIHDICASSEA